MKAQPLKFICQSFFSFIVDRPPNPDDRPCGADRHLIEARPFGILGNSAPNFQESRLVFGLREGKSPSLLTIFPSVMAF